MFQHDELKISRLELLVQPRVGGLAAQVAADIATLDPAATIRTHELAFENPWDFEEVFAGLHEFARGFRFDPDAEDYLIHITTGTHVAQICLFLLTESRHMPGRLIQTGPPRRTDEAPAAPRPLRGTAAGVYQVIDLDLSRYDKLASRFAREHREGADFLKSGIGTRNARFNAMIEQLEQVAVRSRDAILLLGPTGAGKSQLASRIHALKSSRGFVSGPLVSVNCATLRGDQAMSTLFGHVRGAFTGAAVARPGLLVKARGGVLFLDEIGELGADEQAMLLRALEERQFLPLGADREVESDFQLIAGTNRDLLDDVAQGRFREDLLARISLWTYMLPGLRERHEDIEPNIDFELERFSDRTGRRVCFNREAREEFLRFAKSDDADWRSNFRDLGGAITRMATLASTGRIGIDTVAEETARLRAAWRGSRELSRSSTAPAAETAAASLLDRVIGAEAASKLDRFDAAQLAEVLRVCAQCESLSAAGRILFAASRARRSRPNDADRLRKYLARFGVTWERARRNAVSR